MANCPMMHQTICINPPSSHETDLSPIFLVPLPLRSIAQSMFTPQMVHIGPFHHPLLNRTLDTTSHDINFAFKEMQRIKCLAVERISQDLCFSEVVEFLKTNEKKIRGFYKGRLEAYEDAILKSVNLVEMIALDACFITAILHSFFQDNFPQFKDKLSPEETTFLERNRFDAKFHSFYSNKLSRPVRKAIIQDFLLVENQIPLFAVKEIIRVDKRCKGDDYVAGRLLEFYVAAMAHRVLPFNRSRKNVLASVKNLGSKGEHLLDCIYMIVCNHADDVSDEAPPDPYPEEMAGAKKLYRAGVTLHGHGGSLRDLDFKKGKLSIPKIHVGDDTERIFRNLIAYESCYKLKNVDVLSYLHFMDYLIDTPEDVELLIENKVITEHIGSNEKVAEMWNGLCRNTVPVFSYKYKLATQKANEYCNSSWKRIWVEFYRSHLSRPWLVTSLISAVALLSMTFLIMLYAILAYQIEAHPHKS